MKDEPWVKCVIEDRGDGSMSVRGTYCKSFMGQAARIGGRWIGEEKHWLFPIGLAYDVRKLCLEVYGFTDLIAPEFVDVDVCSNGLCSQGNSLYVCGFSIAFTKGQRILSPKTRILSGGFYVEGDGDVKVVGFHKDTVVRIVQFPKMLAQLHPEYIKIVERRRYTSTSRLNFNVEHDRAEGDDISANEIRQALKAQLNSLNDQELIEYTIGEDLHCHPDDVRPIASIDRLPADPCKPSPSSSPSLAQVL